MLGLSTSILIFTVLILTNVSSKVIPGEYGNQNFTSEKSDVEKYYDFPVNLEDGFKKIMKSVLRQVMPSLLQLNEVTDISNGCLAALMKYVKGLTQAKLWAAKMLDASSKLPPGLIMGTFVDFGAFDECLDVEVPAGRNGDPGFRGSSCAIEAKPPMPTAPDKFTLVKSKMANVTDTLGAQFRIAYDALTNKWFRLVVCVPSKCSLEDMQHVALKISNMSAFTVKIPQCYVKENIILQPVHFAVIAALSVLFLLGLIGTIGDIQYQKNEKAESLVKRFFIAFSFSDNFSRLLAPSGGTKELKCIHGIRALGMCWIILGHSYVLRSFDLLKEPYNIQTWFGTLQFELIHNGWLSVETFFLLSGILVSYGGMKSMEKVKGKLNVPFLAFRRYIRLMPPVLLIMGLVFFLPLISSGPFWYEQVDPQVESCRMYWWSTLLFISNWLGIDKGCTLTTWYLSADFQLHVFSLILLLVIFRFTKFGMSLLVACIAISCIAVGIQTIVHDLTPTVFLSTADDAKVFKALNKVHVYTLTHLGPHCIGMILGYYIYRYRGKKPSKWVAYLGWCASIVCGFSAVLGNHRFSTGDETSQFLLVLYASVHRSVYALAISWVVFACVNGRGGPVNSLLSSSILTPISRLTFMMYLLHPLVIWTRIGSLRERPFTSHYDLVYYFLANLMTTFSLAIPFYLLLEAPLSNLERMFFSGSKKSTEADPGKQDSSGKLDWTIAKCSEPTAFKTPP